MKIGSRQAWLLGALLSLAALPSQATSPRTAEPVLDQLSSQNSVVLLVDYQPQYAFSTRSIDMDALINNATALAKAARIFQVPIVVTTISARSYAGPLFSQLQAVIPQTQPFDRTVINAWQDPKVAEAIRATGRKKIIIAGLWTNNCVMLPALSALAEGFQVYVVTDASGDYDAVSHDRAVQRLTQAGAVPMTWLPVVLEWQTDWSNSQTAGSVNQLLRDHAGAISLGAQYRQAIEK